MSQLSLFGPAEDGPDPKPASDQKTRLQVLITVKAAPNPSEKYGETVCVAGLSVDLRRTGWIRLYPINFRELGSDERFRKYDIVAVDAKPTRQDQRRESWKPIMDTMVKETHLNTNARDNANAQSLALVRPKDIAGLEVGPHPGWTAADQRKIDIRQPRRSPAPSPPPAGRSSYSPDASHTVA